VAVDRRDEGLAEVEAREQGGRDAAQALEGLGVDALAARERLRDGDRLAHVHAGAERALAAPVTTAQRIASSREISRQASASARSVFGSSAFARSGRSSGAMWMRTGPSSGATSGPSPRVETHWRLGEPTRGARSVPRT
jgi:hypothetical protein